MNNPGREPEIDARGARGDGGRISIKSIIVLVAAVLFIGGAAFGFQGGTGEPCDPYQIANAEDLAGIRSDIELMSKSFVLVADIDLGPNSPGGRIFDGAVISGTAENDIADLRDSGFRAAGGRYVAVFQGAFFGNGHVIRNIVIDGSETACVGLFAYIGEDAIVSDVRIENACVNGRVHIGLLAGINAGTVSYCAVSGSVSAESRGGGMIGTNLGTVTCCGAETSVTGERMLGGLVGHAVGKSSITHCRVKSRVVGQSKVGGLVGEMLGGNLTGCLARGTVSSSADAGGLVGTGPVGGAVIKCDSRVDVKGVIVGGLIGVAQQTSVSNSHTFGVLAEIGSAGRANNAALGGIVGHWRSGGGSIISCSWQTDTAGTGVAIGRSAPNAAVSLLSVCGYASRAKNSGAGRVN